MYANDQLQATINSIRLTVMCPNITSQAISYGIFQYQYFMGMNIYRLSHTMVIMIMSIHKLPYSTFE